MKEAIAMEIPFDGLQSADLVVDAICKGGKASEVL